jgi:hypothetical protein
MLSVFVEPQFTDACKIINLCSKLEGIGMSLSFDITDDALSRVEQALGIAIVTSERCVINDASQSGL